MILTQIYRFLQQKCQSQGLFLRKRVNIHVTHTIASNWLNAFRHILDITLTSVGDDYQVKFILKIIRWTGI